MRKIRWILVGTTLVKYNSRVIPTVIVSNGKKKTDLDGHGLYKTAISLQVLTFRRWMQKMNIFLIRVKILYALKKFLVLIILTFQ